MPDSLPIENLQPIVLIEETTTEPEVSFLSNIDADDEEEDNDIDLSHAIGQASEQIANMDSVCDLNDENNEYINKDITEFQAQVSLVNQNMSSSISTGKYNNLLLIFLFFPFIDFLFSFNSFIFNY